MQNIRLGINELKKIFNSLNAHGFELMGVNRANSDIHFEGDIAAKFIKEFNKDNIYATIEFDGRIYKEDDDDEDDDKDEDEDDDDDDDEDQYLSEAYNFVHNLYKTNLKKKKTNKPIINELSKVFNSIANVCGFKLKDVVKTTRFVLAARFEKNGLTVFQGGGTESDSHIRAIIKFDSRLYENYNIEDDRKGLNGLINAYDLVYNLYTDDRDILDIGDERDNLGLGKKNLKKRKTRKLHAKK